MSDHGFKAGDEITWGVDPDRKRGLICEDEGGLFVRGYDSFGNLKDRSASSTGRPWSGITLTSAVDLLAEKVPEVWHLCHAIENYEGGRGRPETCYCGAFKVDTYTNPWSAVDHVSADGEALKPIDQTALHHVACYSKNKEWSELIDSTAMRLDHSNRERPLGSRQLPEEACLQAHQLRLCGECFRLAVLSKCWPEEPGRMNKDEMKEFVLGWIDGRVFSDLHCHSPDDLRVVFMCFALMPPPPLDYAEKVGCVWEFMSKAGPRSINGMPGFFSHRLMHKDDWARAAPIIQAEQDRRENFEI